MLVTDLTLRFDPEFEKTLVVFSTIRRRSMKPLPVPGQTDAQGYGAEISLHRTGSTEEDLIWQDPLPQPIYNPTEQALSI